LNGGWHQTQLSSAANPNGLGASARNGASVPVPGGCIPASFAEWLGAEVPLISWEILGNDSVAPDCPVPVPLFNQQPSVGF
jgi:hypothetical protein